MSKSVYDIKIKGLGEGVTHRDRKPANVLIFSQPLTFETKVQLDESVPVNERVPFVDPRALSFDERADLLKKIDAREIVGVRFAAVSFGDRPNRNRFRIAAEEFDNVAQTFVGSMLKLGHVGDADVAIGTIIAAYTRPDDEGVNELILVHEIDDQKAMAAFVNGRYTKFSIELAPSEARCSECDTPMDMYGTYGEFNCEHSYANAEAVLFGARGIGNAVVQNPAYEQAGITAAYFSQHHQQSASRAEEVPMAGTTNPNQGAKNSPPKEAEQPVTFSAAEFEAMKLRAEAAETAAKAAEDKRFKTAFNAAVKERRVEAATAEKWQKRYEKLGADDAIEMLNEQPVNPAFAGEATGFNAGEQGEGEQPNQVADDVFAALDVQAAAGLISAKHVAAYKAARQQQIEAGQAFSVAVTRHMMEG